MMRRSYPWCGVTVAVALSVSLLVSCAGPRQYRVSRQVDAGSVDVAVLSVMEWGDFVSRLDPGFDLSGKDALKKVLPSTALTTEDTFLGVSARAAANLGTKTTKETSSLDEDGVTQQTDDVTEEGGKPPTSAPSRPFSGATDTAEGRIPLDYKTGSLLTKLLPDGLEKDPLLQYQLATALFQEVRVLDEYVRAAAIPSGYDAHVVRVQVSVTPRQRYMPYDVFTTLSYQLGEAGAIPRVAFADREPDEEATGSAGGDGSDKIRVVPLLVTDNIEGIISARSNRLLLELAAAFSGTLGTVGTAGALDTKYERIQRVLARELNSLLTVSRASSNSLRVRFGARVIAEEKYALTTQSHFVTALVLVPKGHKESLSVVARAVFRDAKTGRELPPPSRQEYLARARQFAPDLCHLGDEKLDFLLQCVDQNDFQTFKANITKKPENAHYYWADLAAAREGTHYDRDSIPLQRRPFVKKPRKGQVALLEDDGSDTTRVRLQGARNLQPEGLFAVLRVMTSKPLDFPAVAKRTANDRRDLVLDFPSLEKMGVENLTGNTPVDLKVILIFPGEKRQEHVGRYLRVKPKQESPPFTIEKLTTQIVNKDGERKLRFLALFDKEPASPKPVAFRFVNVATKGTLDSGSDLDLEWDDTNNHWKVKAPQWGQARRVEFSFGPGDLTEGNAVQVLVLLDGKKTSASASIPVVKP